MHKNSSLIQIMTDKVNIAMLCILGMFIGFLCAPALNSISIIVFGANALRDVHPRLWFRQRWWWLALFWLFLYAISYFWSDDKGYWGTRLQVKLPVALLPLAFYFLPRFDARHIQIITLVMNLVLLAGACYSISFLINDYEYYMAQYRYSHLFPTPVRGDHIRFSLAMALTIVWSWYAFPQLGYKWLKWVVGITMSLLAAYMHILAAKSGLITLYVFVVAWCIYYTITEKKVAGLAVLFGVFVLGVVAVNFVPTLKKRFEYTLMNYQIFKNHDKVSVYGDVNRIISYKLAVELIRENPMAGVGVGNMEHRMQERYAKYYPETTDVNRLLPHNQFLVAGLGAGIPCMLLFLIWAIFPVTRIRRNRESFFFAVVWFLLFFQLLIEPVLEVHFGVFVYLFFMLLQWHMVPGEIFLADTIQKGKNKGG